jgi:hypothetical protein
LDGLVLGVGVLPGMLLIAARTQLGSAAGQLTVLVPLML